MTHTTGEQLLRRGFVSRARAAFAAEAESAREAGDVESMARAALGLSGLWVHDHRTLLDRARVAELQQGALDGLASDSELARRLRLRLEVEAHYGTHSTEAVEDMVARAREHDQPTLLADALHLAYFCLLGPEHLRRRRELAEELVTVSAVTGDPLHGLLGLANRVLVLHELGDRGAGRAVHELRGALEQQPCAAVEYALDVICVMRMIGEGRLDAAEAAAAEARALGTEVGDADADTWHAAQVLAILWLRGDLAAMRSLSDAFVDSVEVAEPAQVAFDAARGAAAADSGDAPAARAVLARLGIGRSPLPMSTSWLAAMFAVAEVAYALDDVVSAHVVLDALRPHPGLPVVVSRGVVSFGSTSRALGSAAAAAGLLDEAVDLLTRALEDDLATSTLVCRPHTMWRLAEVLGRRGAPGDRELAAQLRGDALAAARDLGLTHRLQAWSAVTSGGGARLTRVGRTWEVALGERRTTVPTSVGMGYLAQLVANPGVEIASVDLVTQHAVREARSGGVLDEQAVRAYRRRVTELEEQVADADLTGDADTSAGAQAELDALVRELATATGLGGGARTFTDGGERARVSVHKAIRRAMRAIELADPEIGAALRERVSTGVSCSFAAEAS